MFVRRIHTRCAVGGGRVWLLAAMWAAVPAGAADSWKEDFSIAPASRGWIVVGREDLFHWDASEQHLRVTWDSSEPNSYFYRPLGGTLTSADDFGCAFDLRLDDYAAGVRPGKPFAFPIAIGFFNLAEATKETFSRGSGANPLLGPINLVEFNFFPAFGPFAPTIAQVIVSSGNTWLFNHENLLALEPGRTHRVSMSYEAADRRLTTLVMSGTEQLGRTQHITVPANFEFQVDAFSISSYSDQHSQDSILAHGIIDNVQLNLPAPPLGAISGWFAASHWIVSFAGRAGWQYTLERSLNLLDWIPITSTRAAAVTQLELIDPEPPSESAHYRVRAARD